MAGLKSSAMERKKWGKYKRTKKMREKKRRVKRVPRGGENDRFI